MDLDEFDFFLNGFGWIQMDLDVFAINFDVLRIEQHSQGGGAPLGAPPKAAPCCSICKTSNFLANKIKIHPHPSKFIQNHANGNSNPSKFIPLHPNSSKSIRPHILENPQYLEPMVFRSQDAYKDNTRNSLQGRKASPHGPSRRQEKGRQNSWQTIFANIWDNY